MRSKDFQEVFRQEKRVAEGPVVFPKRAWKAALRISSGMWWRQESQRSCLLRCCCRSTVVCAAAVDPGVGRGGVKAGSNDSTSNHQEIVQTTW